MKDGEARELVEREIAQLRALSYEQLLTRLAKPEHRLLTAGSGATYLVEVQVFMDNPKKGRNLRVMASAFTEKQGWRRHMPRVGVTSDFIIDPTGRFVGEAEDD